MKILHVIIGLEASGAELFLKRLVLQQRENQHHVTVISLTSDGKLATLLRAGSVTVYSLGLTGIASIPAVIWRLRKLVKAVAPDIVQSWMYHADFITSLALAGLRQKLIWSVRCSEVPAGSKATFGIMKLCAALSYFKPARVCYVATAAREYHQQHGYCKSRNDVIANGYDFSTLRSDELKRQQYRQQLGIDDSTVLFGMVGRFHPDKGQDLLLEAMSLLQHDVSDAKLVLIGRGCNTENAELANLVNLFSLQQHVLLVGEQTDIPGWLSALDIYVMASRTEGFPNALAEAMSVGVPCVATEVGDAPVLAQTHAVFCRPDSHSLTSAMQSVLNWPAQQRQSFGAEAAAFVRNSFSIAEIEKKYYQMYLKVLESE